MTPPRGQAGQRPPTAGHAHLVADVVLDLRTIRGAEPPRTKSRGDDGVGPRPAAEVVQYLRELAR